MFYVDTPNCKNTEIEDQCFAEHKMKPTPHDEIYKSELQILEENDKHFIQSFAVAGRLQTSKIRSIYWRILLGVLPSSPSEWQSSIQSLRIEYEKIRSDLNLNPRLAECEPNDNPLSQDSNSIWFKYFCDKELKRVISQDVVRTSPEKQFFQSPDVQDIMVNVLFVYARKNPDICYRQGMHEILAFTLHVMYEDCQTFKNQEVDSLVKTKLKAVLDLEYLEHDLYYLFCHIMSRMKKFYESDTDNRPNACGHFPTSADGKSSTFEENQISGISLHINYIMKNILAVHDPTLYQHITKLNVPCTAFGIRWLRLLFGREFSHPSLFFLWDAIFAINSDFCLVNYILTAMLIAIRDKLLNHDYVECLNYLMKYPPIDVVTVVKLALHLKEPTIYRRPLSPVGQSVKNMNNSDNKFTLNEPTSRNLKGIPGRKKTVTKQKLNIRDVVTEEKLSKNYDKIFAEVKHLRVVTSLCKLKLYQYHNMLSTCVSPDDEKAQDALTGLQELCTLLEIDQFSLKSSSVSCAVIEQAHEADDVLSPSSSKLETASTHASQDLVSLYLPPPKTEINMTTFRKVEYNFANPSDFPSEFPHKHGEQN